MSRDDDRTRHPPPGGEGSGETWELRLYVAGMTPAAQTALDNLTRICEEYLPARYHLVVVDLLEHPQLAEGDRIIAVPTLVKRLPEPVRRIVGDLSRTERVLVGLDLKLNR